MSIIHKTKYNKKTSVKNPRNIRGNWEFSFYQKSVDLVTEANIKSKLKPSNSFDPKNVHSYINPQPSKEEVIFEKNQKKEKLNKAEKIILENYISKKKIAIAKDYELIEKNGLNAVPNTQEGKYYLLLYALDYYFKKDMRQMIYSIYFKLFGLIDNINQLCPDIYKKYSVHIDKMNEIMSQQDIIKLQFNDFHHVMPPLDTKGFVKFDPWQIEVINLIDKNASIIVNAKTSAGKSVLSAYAVTKGATLFVVPTDALAWQMASYIGGIVNKNIPILTQNYQSDPNRDGMIKLLASSDFIVGTSESIVDYLPFIKTKFKRIVLDEIHMIGKLEGSAMEHIIKVLNNIPILALSATIGNTDELSTWIKSVSEIKDIHIVYGLKRFFNLQRYYYDIETNNLNRINPLGLVTYQDFVDGSIKTKNLEPTPPDVWDLMETISKHLDLGDLKPDSYFSKEKKIELNEAFEYFNKLIQFMCDKNAEHPKIIETIVKSYTPENIKTDIDLVKLAFKLKEGHKSPTIIFQPNSVKCLKIVREFAKTVEDLEMKAFPNLIADREKLMKLAKKEEKKVEKVDVDIDSRKALKQLYSDGSTSKDAYGESGPKRIEVKVIETVPIQEPHSDWIFTQIQHFSEPTVEQWVKENKRYFPSTGEFYHWVIKLLWRGVGVYVKGLPESYLRLVQSLACNKQLGIVFSDISLTFGVSMPFRSVVILPCEMDGMMFHQMCGRAGRRGLDKEGNIIFAGFDWETIKHYSTIESPNVVGADTSLYSIPHANKLSKSLDWDRTSKSFLDKSINPDDATEFFDGIASNYESAWNWALSDDTNHLNMCWRYRTSQDGIILSFLMPYLKRGWEFGKDPIKHKYQIEIAHFLSRFITGRSSEKYALEEPEIMKTEPFNQIYEKMEELGLEIPNNVDGRVFQSIKMIKLVGYSNEEEYNKLRDDFFDFGLKVKILQNFCYQAKMLNLSIVLAKLLTRIWRRFHNSSPITLPLGIFELEEEEEESDDEDSDDE